MSNEPQPQPSNQGQDSALEEERANMAFMKQQLEGAKKQLREATRSHGQFDSMSELLALQEGMSLEEARARALETEQQSFGIAFEDGRVETTKKRAPVMGESVAQEEIRRAQTVQSEIESATSAVDAVSSVHESRFPEMQSGSAVAPSDTATVSLNLHPEALPWLMKNGVCLFRDAEQPFEGFEDELLALTTRVDQFAWLRVFSFFPELNGLSAELMRAFVRGNLCAYSRNKLIEDYLVSTGQHSRHDVPLGFAQITAAKVLQLEQDFPQLAAFFAGAGYVGPAHESLVLLDPTCVPILVAAYVASLVEELNEQGIEVNDWTIAYAFHPDVYAHSDGGDGTVYAVLEGIDVSLSKVKHWDQHLEFYAENDAIISHSQQVKRIVAQLVHLASA
ncbi:MAG TPA: hypothetical protein EYN91_19750 [Candidatus Melainabacteria bacterium]|nr:hypothetical protein [Candidatus Melainabacteria bacterium]HIN66027.1 hypothetical protein [Candidatus Obscuribacterales bacterium]